jgi:hypothetical protein
VSIASAATLLVAELDLKMVQSILSAIHNADAESAAEKKAPLPAAQNQNVHARPGTPLHCDTRVEHCPEHLPTKIGYSARPRRPAQQGMPGAMPVVIETVIVQKKYDDLCSPLRAPWEQPIWNTAAIVPAKIKINRYEPDIHHIGTMIDYFI